MSKPELLLDVASDGLFDRLRLDCAWPNPGAKRDKLSMSFRDRERPAPLPWQQVHPLVRELADELAERLGASFNSCAVQRYMDGSVHGVWHSDDDLDPSQPVVIVSLGAVRPFWTRLIGSPVYVERLLFHRSAFVMPPGFQQTHEHCLPAVGAGVGERLGLVFAGV